MLIKTVLQVVETRHCHTKVSPSENGPRSSLASDCWNKSNLTEYAGIGRNSKKDMKRVIMWQPSRFKIVSKFTKKGKK